MFPLEVRSRGACLTCKSRKKKCDQEKPSCARCTRGGYLCRGYDTSKRSKQQAVDSTSSANHGKTRSVDPVLAQASHDTAPTATLDSSASSSLSLYHAQSATLYPATIHTGVFANDFLNNLLHRYYTFYTLMSNTPSEHASLMPVLRARALQSAVNRNSMLSVAALLLSQENLENTLSWKHKALQFHTNAQSLLPQELSRKEISTVQKVSSVLGVLMFELITRTCRAESSIALLQKGKSLVNQAQGLSTVINISAVPWTYVDTTLLAWMDVLSSVYLCRPTSFILESKPLSDDTKCLGGERFTRLENVVCCPDAITVALCEISNLREQVRQDKRRDGAVSESTLSAAARIEDTICSWRPHVSDSLSLEGSTFLCAQECWRSAALIYLYQSVHHVGALHPVMVNAVRAIIDLSRLLPLGSAPEKRLSTPYFFAGTIAVHPKDRAYLREWLMMHNHVGEQKGVSILDEVWARSDITGLPIDWMEVGRGWPAPKSSGVLVV